MLNLSIKKEGPTWAIPRAYIFIGRSGCGKGTQADLLSEFLCDKYKSCRTLHIETGAFLREFIKGDSYTQTLSREIVENGGLMPEAVMVALWEDYLFTNYTGGENLIFDGCPRKLPEAQLLDSAFDFYKVQLPIVFHINVGRDWAVEKLTNRSRKDDNAEAIERRLKWFDVEVEPTINFYKNNPDYIFIEINGEQRIEEVQKEILQKAGLD